MFAGRESHPYLFLRLVGKHGSKSAVSNDSNMWEFGSVFLINH
jgi:hypothetical protein